MRPWVTTAAGLAALTLGAARAHAQAPAATAADLAPNPAALSLLPDDRSVYAPPAPPRDDEGVNAGGVHIDLNVRYVTDNVFRGVDRSEVGGPEDAPNLQFDGRLSFDLGKLPHPFVGAFVNVYDSDPVSRFQEVRPYFGFQWNLRPFLVEAGNVTYIFPERDDLNTAEVYGRVTFDDSWLFRTDRPILSPYVYVAYDYDKYDGWYVEAGLKHEMVIEGTGLTLTGVANIAYVLDHGFFALTPNGKDTGLQHYQVGLIASYSLNHLFQLSPRYGTFTLEGYVFYDDRTSTDLRADIQIWGGMGIGFKY
jgi:hypothetical protein